MFAAIFIIGRRIEGNDVDVVCTIASSDSQSNF